jgi:hypothetical protein
MMLDRPPKDRPVGNIEMVDVSCSRDASNFEVYAAPKHTTRPDPSSGARSLNSLKFPLSMTHL